MKNQRIIASLLAIVIAISTIFTISVPVFASESNDSSILTTTTKFDPNEWLMADAYYDETNEYFVLTEDYSSWQTGSVWYNHPYDNNFTLEMDYYTGSSNRSLGGADGIVVAFYANYSYTMSSGEEMGFTGCGGFGVELDTYHNGNQGDPSNNHIALIKGNVGTHLVTNTLSESEDEQWHHLKVVVEDGVCTAYVDGNEKFSHAVEETGYGWIGITSATGNGHNLHAVKNVIVTGNSSTSIDGRYLDLKLSHRKVSNNCTDDTAHGVYEYEITAEIKNSAEATARDIVATLDLKEGLRLADGGSVSIDLGDVASGESSYAKWTVYADWPDSNIAANYGVTANIGNSASLRQESYIYLIARNENDNTLTYLDWWSFLNSGNNFTNLEVDKNNHYTDRYYITNGDWDALIAGLSELEIDLIQRARNSNWGGSCYGMSVIVALTKMGVIEPQNIPTNPSSLSQAIKSNDDALESFINFYHLQQNTTVSINDRSQFATLDTVEQLALIEDLASQVSVGGYPFLLCISGDEGGHAIVGYGVEYGEFVVGSTNYDSRILTYDCSNLAEPESSFLYYNTGTDEWCIEFYSLNNPYRSLTATKLIMATNDIEVLDAVNHEVESTNRTARIVFNSQMRGYYLFYNGNRFFIDPTTDLRREGIITYFEPNMLADGTFGESVMTLVLPKDMQDYTLVPVENSEIDMTIYYEDVAYSIQCESLEQIDFKADTGLFTQEMTGDYTISALFNIGASPTAWNKTAISGQNGGNVSLTNNADGIALFGDNLQNASIETTSKDGTQITTLSTNCSSVLLTNDEASSNIPIVMLDSNGDGSFDSEYNKYSISFDPNGGTGNMNSLENVVAGPINLPDNSFTPPTGMRFKGWFENATGDVILSSTYNVTEDATLYAIWEEIDSSSNTQPDSGTTEDTTPDEPDNLDNDSTEDTGDDNDDKFIDAETIKLIAIVIVVAGVLIGVIILIIKKRK